MKLQQCLLEHEILHSLHKNSVFCTHTAWGSLNFPTCCIWYMRSPPFMYSMTKYKRSWGEIDGYTEKDRSKDTEATEKEGKSEKKKRFQITVEERGCSKVDGSYETGPSDAEKITWEVNVGGWKKGEGRGWRESDDSILGSVSNQSWSDINSRTCCLLLSTPISNKVRYEKCWWEWCMNVCICVFKEKILSAVSGKSPEQLSWVQHVHCVCVKAYLCVCTTDHVWL